MWAAAAAALLACPTASAAASVVAPARPAPTSRAIPTAAAAAAFPAPPALSLRRPRRTVGRRPRETCPRAGMLTTEPPPEEDRGGGDFDLDDRDSWWEECYDYEELMGAPSELSRVRRRTIFNHERWLRHRSSDRFVRNLSTIPGSYLLRNLMDEVAVILSVCALVILWNGALFEGFTDLRGVHSDAPLAELGTMLPELRLPALPFSLSSSALGLLLVFRSNASYARWMEGRKAWDQILTQSRQMLLTAESAASARGGEGSGAAVDRLAASAWAFSRVLKSRLWGPGDPYDDLRADVLRGGPTRAYPGRARELLRSRDRPLRALRDLHRAAEDLEGLIDPQRAKVNDCMSVLGECRTTCERLYRSPIPLSYTRHTARSLAVWLLFLPTALYDPFAESWNHTGMVPVAAVLALLFLGVEEIAVTLEEPFSILPLDALCDELKATAEDLRMWRDEDG